MKGANLRTKIQITFEEAVFGCSKEIELNVKETCKTCQGTGKVIKEKCTDCHGRGYISMKKRYSVDIPAGINNGQAIRMPGLGEPGSNGGPRGDVLVEIIVGQPQNQLPQVQQSQVQQPQPQQSQIQQPQPTFMQKMEAKADKVQEFLRNGSPQGNSGIKGDGVSLQDEDGFGSVCSVCGQPMIGFGRFGGYCVSCKSWNYDRAAYQEKLTAYGAAAESLFVLAAYPNTHCRCRGEDYTGVLFVMPSAMILKAQNGKRLQIPYADISAVSATKGVNQQLVILVRGDDTQPLSYNIDLKGCSYDGANGEDFLRIRQLIQDR